MTQLELPNNSEKGTGEPLIGCAEFFSQVPPGIKRVVSVRLKNRSSSIMSWLFPRIQIWCDHPDCSGVRYFDPVDESKSVYVETTDQVFVEYSCSNCEERTKLFAVSLKLRDATTAELIKLGEDPPFGPPLSSRLLKLVGSSAGVLKKGYRCEKEGLGIGAFGYYRRVLDQQRIGIFDSLIEVSRLLGAVEVAHELENARTETQFRTAVEAVRHGLPDALYIEGHNPLTLLHSALSEGLHELSDDQCLEIASHVRLVLTELADRLNQLRKDDKELKTAVGRLSQRKKPTS